MKAILDRTTRTPRRLVSAVLATSLLTAMLLALPFGGAAQVHAATPTPTPIPKHSYALTATTETAVVAQLELHYQDAIAHQYDCFTVVTSSVASEAYLYARFSDSRILLDRFLNQFNLPKFDYEAGIRQLVAYNLAGINLPAGAKTLTVMVQWKESATDRERVRTHARAFLDSAAYPRTGTDDQKLSAINTYIGSTFDYDSTTGNSSAAIMLDTHKGVCSAYTLYGYVMLTEAGYSARTVTSRVDIGHNTFTPYAYPDGLNGEKGAHAWLLVQVGANWYHMDFTWNDPVGSVTVNKKYYMRTDTQMGTDHKWKWNDTSVYSPSPAATSPYYPAASVVWSGVVVSPTPVPTARPTATPTPKPTATPTSKPTATPPPKPTATPTFGAVITPTPTPPPFSTPDPTSASVSPATSPTSSAEPTRTISLPPDRTPLGDPDGDIGQRLLYAVSVSWRNSPVGTLAVAAGAVALLLLLGLLAAGVRKRRVGR
jgi:hypothetical protein